MQKNTKKILLVSFVLIFCAFVFKTTFAQDFTQEDYNKILEDFYNKASSLVQQKSTNFEINLNPKYPGANTKVTTNIISYSFNVDRAYIAWTVNGKVVEQGRGKKSITFKTGDAGTTVYLSVSVTTENDLNLSENKEIKIGELDLLWQTNTYTPPFYRGKAMPTKNSSITVTAVPQGLGSPGSLIYNWQRNFKNLPNVSGAGKNSISFSFTDVSSVEDLGVKISAINGDDLMEKKISIKLKEPEVVLYEESPLGGVLYQKALSSEILLFNPEIVLRAEPYFFLKSDLDSLSYEWKMNGELIESLSKANTIGLNTPSDSTSGTTIINLQIKNISKHFQQITKNLRLSF